MNAFQRALASNNHGIKLLESLDILRAITVFQDGIKQIKVCGAAVDMSQTYVPESEPEHSPCIQSHTTLHDEVNTEEDCRLHFSYNRPIELSSYLTSYLSHSSDNQLHIISSILLFNLALAHRSYRYTNQKSSSNIMLQEVMIYKLALSILEFGGCVGPLGKIMMILILTNLADLYYEFCDYEVSHYLFSTINQLVSHDAATNAFAMSILSEEEWIELQLNCVYSHIPSAAASA